jgi:hypothetical protein
LGIMAAASCASGIGLIRARNSLQFEWLKDYQTSEGHNEDR